MLDGELERIERAKARCLNAGDWFGLLRLTVASRQMRSARSAERAEQIGRKTLQELMTCRAVPGRLDEAVLPIDLGAARLTYPVLALALWAQFGGTPPLMAAVDCKDPKMQATAECTGAKEAHDAPRPERPTVTETKTGKFSSRDFPATKDFDVDIYYQETHYSDGKVHIDFYRDQDLKEKIPANLTAKIGSSSSDVTMQIGDQTASFEMEPEGDGVKMTGTIEGPDGDAISMDGTIILDKETGNPTGKVTVESKKSGSGTGTIGIDPDSGDIVITPDPEATLPDKLNDSDPTVDS
jgi:hypothetical protein